MPPTGTLKVLKRSGNELYSWNGVAEDRERARAVFNEAIKDGFYLAMVVDSPNRAHQVTSFEEIEQVEQERGYVEAKLQPGIVGG